MNKFLKLQKKIEHYKNKYKSDFVFLKISFYSLALFFRKNKKVKSYKNDLQKNDALVLDGSNKISVLVELWGGLGDFICTLNFIKILNIKFKNELNFYVSSRSSVVDEIKIILNKHNFIKGVFDESTINVEAFDVYLVICRATIVKYYKLERIQTTNFYNNFLKEVISFNNNNNFFLSSPGTTCDRLLISYSNLFSRKRIEQYSLNNSIKIFEIFKIYLNDVSHTLQKFELLNSKFILLMSGSGQATRENGSKNCTRDWAVKNYSILAQKIKSAFSELLIVQLGNSDDEEILNVDIDLRGKTSFKEMLNLVASAYCLITTESGPVHFRHFTSHRTSIVLFGPTSPNNYGYPENINIISPACNDCEWVCNNWRTFCQKSHSSNSICMQAITPSIVLKHFLELVKRDEGCLNENFLF